MAAEIERKRNWVRRTLQRAARDRNARLAAGGAALTGAAIAAGRAIAARVHDRSTAADEHSRAFRLRPDEPVADGIRRVALGRTDSALEHLQATADEGATAAAVHDARKDLKKLRSTLRLVRDELGDELYRRENTRFRDAGRALAGARDAEVKLATLDALAERFEGEFPNEAARPLVEALARERETLTCELESDSRDGPRALAARQIAAGRSQIADWPLGDGAWALAEPGLRRAYRRGRRRFADVRAEPSDENVHEWRKRVKDLWYHLRLLRDRSSEVTDGAIAEADDLSDLLGEHHDLAVLADDLAARDPSPDGGLGLLAKLIARRQQELLGDAVELGARVYAEKPKAFTKRLAWT